MKIFLTLFLFALLSGCSVASLASTAVSTAAKIIIIEVPIKAIGKAVTRDDDEEDDEEEED